MRTGDTNSLLSYIKGSWNSTQTYLYTVNPFASGTLLVAFRIKYFLLHSLTCGLLASLHSPCACLKSPKNPREGVSCSASLPFIQHAHHDLIGKPTSWVKRAEPYAVLRFTYKNWLTNTANRKCMSEAHVSTMTTAAAAAESVELGSGTVW